MGLPTSTQLIHYHFITNSKLCGLIAISNLLTTHELLEELLACDNHHARAAATKQRGISLPDYQEKEFLSCFRKAANDKNGLVRMKLPIATSCRPRRNRSLSPSRYPWTSSRKASQLRHPYFSRF